LINIRDLNSLRDFEECIALQDKTWGARFSERVPGAILRVAQMIGGVAAGAFDENERMAGFVFGLTGVRNRELVHWSDMLAVREDLRGQGIGEQLKQYQRDKVVALGVRSMLWTFDPLQAGNAHFNINHLGAMPIEYVTDMYGDTGSALHGALPTDRFIVRWQLDALAQSSAESVPSSAPIANPLNENGEPIAAALPDDIDRVRVQVPSDFGAIRDQGDDTAMRWRVLVRDVLTELFARDFEVTGFHRPDAGALPCYVLERRSPGSARP